MAHLVAGREIIWGSGMKILFRFLFIYFALYCIPFPLDAFGFTHFLAQPFYQMLDWMIPVLGNKIFHLKARASFPMFDKFDDSYYGLVFLYTILSISFIGTIIWSIADRRRLNYNKLYQWLKLYLRFFLAAYLFGYGFVKVFPSQFQALTASRLTMPVGDQSPMLLAWNFMGYSTAFTVAMGLAEVMAGLLVLFRKTTTLGALLSFGIFGYVVLMDFCFHVPVRLLSSHLLFISFYLILEDRQKLLQFFVYNKAVAPRPMEPLVASARGRKILMGIQGILGIGLVWGSLTSSIESERQFGHGMTENPLYGIYQTNYFVRNKDSLLPLDTDTFRWKQLVIDGGSWRQSAVIEFNTGQRKFFDVVADTVKKTLQMQSQEDTSLHYIFNYTNPDPFHIRLEGYWGKDSLKMLLAKYDLDHYLLHREKFKWIEQ